jgi:hypothetical protein
VVCQRNPLFVELWHSENGIAVHFHAAIVKGPHGVDPGLLGRVDEAGIDPAGHSIDLSTQKMIIRMQIFICKMGRSIMHAFYMPRPAKT